MKGVVLAGGRGTRLQPLTLATSKQLLPVGGEPMVYHPVRRLVEAGISDILVIVGPEHSGQTMNALGDGETLGARVTYRVQTEPLGIAHGIGLAEGFVGADRFVVLLGDNIWQEPLTSFVERFARQPAGCRVLLKEVDDPERFGVASWFRNGSVGHILEKPIKPPTNLAVLGCYAYTPRAFDLIRSLQPSYRGELEVSDLNNAHAPEIYGDLWTAGWVDAGTIESLRAADQILWGVTRG